MKRPPAGAAAAKRRHERAMAAADGLAEILSDGVGAITALAKRETQARAMTAAGPTLVAAGSTFGVDNLPTPQAAVAGAEATTMPAIPWSGIFNDLLWESMLLDAEGYLTGFIIDELELEFEIEIVAEQPFVQQTLRSHMASLSSWGDEFRSNIRRVIEQGFRETQSVQQVAKAIEDAGLANERRSILIARTEMISASNGATYLGASAIANPGDRKKWMCVAGDTQISAIGPRQIARRWHWGEVIRLTAHGPGRRDPLVAASGVVGQCPMSDPTVNHLTITPNHPVLTTRGWVRAEGLKPGDKLVGHLLADRLLGGDPDVPDQPATAAEVFSALAVAGNAVGVAGVVVDFDGHWRECQVDVVEVDGELGHGIETALPEQLAQFHFAPPDAALVKFPGPRLGQPRLDGIRLDGPPSTDGRCHLLVGHERGAEDAGLGLVADGDTRICEPSYDGGLGHSVVAGQRQDGGRLVEASKLLGGRSSDTPDGNPDLLGRSRLFGGFGVEIEPEPCGLSRRPIDPETPHTPVDCHAATAESCRDLGAGLSSEVPTLDVVQVERLPFAGHVYDLSADVGWYVANGVVVANSSHDDRVRPDHVDADGQEVDFDKPFKVGNEYADYPGAPNLSPRQRASCRCSWRVIYAD